MKKKKKNRGCLSAQRIKVPTGDQLLAEYTKMLNHNMFENGGGASRLAVMHVG